MQVLHGRQHIFEDHRNGQLWQQGILKVADRKRLNDTFVRLLDPNNECSEETFQDFKSMAWAFDTGSEIVVGRRICWNEV